jgi:multidrug resistance efflux pump
LTAVALSAGPLRADDLKAAPKAGSPDKKAAEPAPAETPPTQKVKREPFKIELSLKGVFEAQTMAEVVLRPEVWSNAEVVKAVEHGQAVKRGDLLVQCDLSKIDDEIADLRVKAAISEVALKQADENLRSLEAATPLDLKLAERTQRNAEEDLARFLKIDRPMMEKMADFYLKMSEHMLEYEREELRQLEKMYKADELTEETEEIVLRRQRNAVESAEFMLQRARVSRDETLQIELPRRKETMEQNSQRQELLASKTKITLPAALEQQRRELAKLKLERARDEEKLKKLLADRETLTIRAAADGVVYYGRFTRGKWSGADTVAENLRRGGSISKNAVVMTIVAPRPMFVRAAVGEGDLDKIRAGLAATVRPSAYPDLKLPGSVTRVEGIPSTPESFDAQIDVKLDGSDKRAASIVPGMACTVKLIPYADRRALVVPAKAVFEEEMDEDSRYVFVAGKDGKPQKRPVVVGKKSDDKVEIIRGLAEQDEVLLERPKESSAGRDSKKEPPQKEPPKKAAETPQAKEPAKKDSTPETPKKADPPKKKSSKKESSKKDGAKK